MTENKGDLISREALKKSFEDTVCIEPMPYAFVKQIIDNAPTIKTFTLEDIEEQYRKGLEKGLSEWETERPQGEWIFLKANEEQTDGYECSVCKRTYHTRVAYFSEYNFCPICGASMKKGGAT